MINIKRSNFIYMLVLIVILVGETLLYTIYPNLPPHKFTVLIQLLLILLPSILYLLFSKLNLKATLRLNSLNKRSILISLLIGLCSLPLVGTIGNLSELFFHNYIQDSIEKFPSMPLVAWIGILALAPAICEEIFLRGVVLSGYKNVSLKKAAIMNGFLFGMFHMNFNQFLYTFILGIILAYTVSITNSIFSAMIIHFTFNTPSSITAYYMQNSKDVYIEPVKVFSEYAPKELINFLLSNTSVFIISLGILVLLINSLKKTNNYLPRVDTFAKKERVFTISIFVSVLIFLLISVGTSLLTNTPV